MKKSLYSEEQIIGILKQHEAGVKTVDVCREHGISAATFYGWKQKFGGMEDGVPGLFRTSSRDRDCMKRSLIWRRARSIHRNRS
jgi:transposase-like protein